jgi:hypothetical protein
MEPEDSLPCSQQPSIDPYPEPDNSSPYHPILQDLGFSSYPFPSGFRIKTAT